MSTGRISFGEFLKPNSRAYELGPNEDANLVGMRLYGAGPFHRELKSALKIAKKSHFVIRAGDVIYNKLFAWKGTFGVVSSELDGMFVSDKFPTYELDRDKVDERFLRWVFRYPPLWAEARILSTGSAALSKLTLNPPKFLHLTMPYFELAEQQRIVARIEALSAKIDEARDLRKQAVEEAEALLPSCLHQIFEAEAIDWKVIPMPEAISVNDKQVDPTLPQFSGLPHISGENMESKTCRLLPYRTAEQDDVRSGNYLFSEGTILYSKIRPYLQKAVFVDFGGVCSADVYPIKVTNSELEPRFVMWSLVASPFTDYANRLSGRTRMPKLNRKQLFGFTYAYPPLNEQRRIVAHLDGLQSKVDALKKLQAETAAELAALLPSILDKAFKGQL